MYEKTVLGNGLRLVTSFVPHVPSVCIGIFVGAGPRYESPAESGISHFIEHLCFKGTEHWPTAKDISGAIEEVGGILNGGTDKELSLYWCKVARPHFPLALEVLADVVCHPRFDPQDIEKERQIINEEIKMSWDSPQHRVATLVDEVMWSGQPLGRDVAGSRESVAAIGRDLMFNYRAHRYLPNNAVVSIVGGIAHQEVVTSIKEALGDWSPAILEPGYATDDAQEAPRCRVEFRSTEQANLCLAIRGLSLFHPDRFVLDLLNVILGQGMSSRLFTEIRERQGLAYDIHSYTSHYLDSGALTIYAGVDPDRVETALASIIEQLSQLREKIPETEIHKAKEFTKGHLLLRMEDTRNIAGWLGGQELLSRSILTVDEVVALIDAITADDLRRVAQDLLLTEKLNLAIVGPVKREEHLEEILRL